MPLKEGCNEDIQKTVIVHYHLQSLLCLYLQLSRSLWFLCLSVESKYQETTKLVVENVKLRNLIHIF